MGSSWLIGGEGERARKIELGKRGEAGRERREGCEPREET